MPNRDYICSRCGEYLGDVTGLLECPICGKPILDEHEE